MTNEAGGAERLLLIGALVSIGLATAVFGLAIAGLLLGASDAAWPGRLMLASALVALIGLAAAIAANGPYRERQRIARCRAAGMDDELAGLIGRALPDDRIDLALAHWSDPAVVAQWRDEGWFELREDGHVLFFCRSLQRSVGGRSQPRSRARRA